MYNKKKIDLNQNSWDSVCRGFFLDLVGGEYMYSISYYDLT